MLTTLFFCHPKVLLVDFQSGCSRVYGTPTEVGSEQPPPCSRENMVHCARTKSFVAPVYCQSIPPMVVLARFCLCDQQGDGGERGSRCNVYYHRPCTCLNDLNYQNSINCKH
uniref:Uncharacterized protein n=1 Tax=Schistocephalus solidus TaxID=70667 RepID=A0A0X3NPM0_SCHSO